MIGSLSAQKSYQSENLARDHQQQTEEVTGNPKEREQDINPTALMLKVDCKLGHLPFSKIKVMVENGTLDGRISNCCLLVCTTCSYGKSNKEALEELDTKSSHWITAKMEPATCISVTPMETQILGLVTHMKGNPTTH